MKKTSNFNLLKPEGNERYNIEEFNENMDIIDRRMHANMQAAVNSDQHISNTQNPHLVTKEQVGLGRVDNTSDSEKPVSIPQQAALDEKQNVLDYDSVPTENSMNAVRSGGIFAYIKSKWVAFKGATTSAAGALGLVPAPKAGSANRFLRSSGSWEKVTASDVGLGKVGNYKAVSTETGQALSSLEQQHARENIGAGTSSFNGDFDELHNVPQWLKSQAKPSYSASEVGAYSKSEINTLIAQAETANIPKATSENDGLMTKEQAAKLDNVQSALKFDSKPTEDSSNMLTSGGIFSALKNLKSFAKNFTPSTASGNGEAGLVPPPPKSDKTLFLSSKGSWSDPSIENTNVFAVGQPGIVPAPTAMDSDKYLRADGTWGTPSGQGGTTVITDPGLARRYFALKYHSEQNFENIWGEVSFTATITQNNKGENIWTFDKENQDTEDTCVLKVISTLDDEEYVDYYLIYLTSVWEAETQYTDSQISSFFEIISFPQFFLSQFHRLQQQCVSKDEVSTLIDSAINNEILEGNS